MKRNRTGNFEVGELLLIVFLVLTIVLESTGKMVCKTDSICRIKNRESCCRTVRGGGGICSPKIQLGKKCQKNLNIKWTNEGYTLSSCGCAKGLTCTRSIVKRKHRKEGKKPYRIKHRCLPIQKEKPERSELFLWS